MLNLKHKGWLAPSIENKIQTHFSIIKKYIKYYLLLKLLLKLLVLIFKRLKILIYKERISKWGTNEFFGMLGNMCCLETDINVMVKRLY